MEEQKKQYQVLDIEKRISVSSALGQHFLRKSESLNEKGEIVFTTWLPDNADGEKTHLNKDYISHTWEDEDGVTRAHSIQQHVNKRIEESGATTRSTCNTSLLVLLSGSPETMNAMDEETLNQWAEDSLQWVKDTFGEENLVHASLHRDETTPHIHCVVVPILKGLSRRTAKKWEKDREKGRQEWVEVDVNRNRLSACDVFNQTNLYKFHDTYHKTVGKKYGLERGVRAESGSKKKHQDSIDYNRELERTKMDLNEEIEQLKKEQQEERMRRRDELQTECLEIQTDCMDNLREIKEAAKELPLTEPQETQADNIERLCQEVLHEMTLPELKEEKKILKQGLKQVKELLKTIRKGIKEKFESDKADREGTLVHMDIQIENAKLRKTHDEAELIRAEERMKTAMENLTAAEKQVKALNELWSREAVAEARDKENISVFNPPAEGLIGYKTGEVRTFVESVNKWRNRVDIKGKALLPEYSQVMSKSRQDERELEEYRILKNSPEQLQARLQFLKAREEEEKRIKGILPDVRYLMREDVEISHCEPERALSNGRKCVFFRFTTKGQDRKGVLFSDTRQLIHTGDSRVNTFKEIEPLLKEKIWKVLIPLEEEKKIRHRNDIVNKYQDLLTEILNRPTKLSLLDEAAYKDGEEEGTGYLFRTDDNRTVFVTCDDKIKVTHDTRINSIKDYLSLNGEVTWKIHRDYEKKESIKQSAGTHTGKGI